MNLGLRYDITDGLSNIDQTKNPNYILVRNAAIAGKFNTLAAPVGDVMNHFALDPRIDKTNIQPRIGLVYNIHGDATDVVRGGWGIYSDFGYINSNVLFAAADSGGSGFGNVFNVNTSSGIRKADGTLFTVNDPLSTIAGQNQAPAVPGQFPLFGSWVDPTLKQPRQYQSNVGWSRKLAGDSVVTVDFVDSLGRDLNTRPRVNQRIPGSLSNPRIISAAIGTALTPNSNANRPSLSVGTSHYDAAIFALRRRLSKGVDFTASYTLARATSTIGVGVDQLNTANIQDPNNPFDAPVQNGPTVDTDARHRIGLSAVFELPYGIRVSPVYLWRSALPVALVDGRDLNLDGDATEIPSRAFAVATFDPSQSLTSNRQITFVDIGACTTVNCGRGLAQQQMNVRFEKVFSLAGRATVAAFADIFNLFNAINPSGFKTRAIVPSTGLADPTLLQPTSFSGDFRRPEQRVGQIGFRFAF